VPLNFLRRKKRSLDGKPADVTTGERPAAKVRSGVAFDGLTEEWRLVGRMQVEGRLSDALNKREAIEISDVQWAPIDGSGEFSPAPGLRSVDPYDLIIVLAGEGSMPELTETERAAHKVHKVTFGFWRLTLRRQATVPRPGDRLPAPRHGTGSLA
jgi:hypothetical protein